MTAPEKDNKRWHVQLRCESILGNRVMLACSNRAILAAPGRPKGSRNKINRDLMEMILNAATWTGYIKTADDLARIASGGDACEKFLSWLRVHHPKAMAGLLVRILPYRPSVKPPGRGTLSREETLAQDIRHNK